jgi:hypothetical protein
MSPRGSHPYKEQMVSKVLLVTTVLLAALALMVMTELLAQMVLTVLPALG